MARLRRAQAAAERAIYVAQRRQPWDVLSPCGEGIPETSADFGVDRRQRTSDGPAHARSQGVPGRVEVARAVCHQGREESLGLPEVFAPLNRLGCRPL